MPEAWQAVTSLRKNEPFRLLLRKIHLPLSKGRSFRNIWQNSGSLNENTNIPLLR